MNQKLIDIDSYPVSIVLKQLLCDKTTGKNIILATNAYKSSFESVDERTPITIDLLHGIGAKMIQPRVSKSLEAQAERTKQKAEVFTPSWICNKMNNHCDEEWFGRKDVFNTEDGQTWIVNEDKIAFKESDGWKKYVDSKRLEITCGEAPYLVSRYDTTTGELIPIEKRIGILDRKLRVVSENTDTEADWLEWTLIAFKSVYGYEFQGDNLLIARINLLITYVDYMQAKLGRVPTDIELKEITNVIIWNIWQMDGITGRIPFENPEDSFEESNLAKFGLEGLVGFSLTNDNINCVIMDWDSNKKIEFTHIKEGDF